MAKSFTKGQIEAEITKGMIKFEKDHMGRGPEDAETHLINDIVFVRFKGVLTAAERQLAKNSEGTELIKKLRSNLVENSREILEKIISDITGTKVVSLHMDISTVTGEKVIILTVDENIEKKYLTS